jgi:hypothetical protein
VRFSLRELLFATTFAGLGLAWWLDHRWSAAERRALIYEHATMKTELERVGKMRDELLQENREFQEAFQKIG